MFVHHIKLSNIHHVESAIQLKCLDNNTFGIIFMFETFSIFVARFICLKQTFNPLSVTHKPCKYSKKRHITFKFSGVNSNGIEGLFSGVSRC